MKPFWSLGFRPFFLFGSAWSSLHILLWVAFQSGYASGIHLSDPIVWHAHEMIFGFAAAIIAGFILTASQNWTGIRGIHGVKLMILVGLWMAARFLSVIGGRFPLLFAIVDLSFFPILGWYLKPYLWQSSQKRNQIFFILFFVLFLNNLIIHANSFHVPNIPSARSILLLSVYIVIIMITLIGGRVIPFFTSNVLPKANPIRQPWIDWASILLTAITGLAVTSFEFSSLTAYLAFLTGLIHFVRWLFWKPWKSIRIPILFILYLGYIWIPIGFFLRGLASLSMILPSLSTHAFTAGAIGIMIYAMITRVSLGHSGLPIHASKPIICGYGFIVFSAITRVFGPWIIASRSLLMIEISGCFWFIAFFIFTIIYTPILWNPRIDGKEG